MYLSNKLWIPSLTLHLLYSISDKWWSVLLIWSRVNTCSTIPSILFSYTLVINALWPGIAESTYSGERRQWGETVTDGPTEEESLLLSIFCRSIFMAVEPQRLISCAFCEAMWLCTVSKHALPTSGLLLLLGIKLRVSLSARRLLELRWV